MARYEHLPIYKTAMDLTVYLEQVVRNFSRYHKYALGSDLRQQSRELVTVIIRANSRTDKLPVLYELRERLEGLQKSCSGSVRKCRPFRSLRPMGAPLNWW